MLMHDNGQHPIQGRPAKLKRCSMEGSCIAVYMTIDTLDNKESSTFEHCALLGDKNWSRDESSALLDHVEGQ